MTRLAFYIMSDVHGYIFPTDFTQPNSNQAMGLLLANHIIEQDRVQYDSSFKIDNGDFLQGSPLCHYLVSHLSSSRPLTAIYNQMDFDFGTLGNHEFNYGLDYLKDTINQLNYPILCANILENNMPLSGQAVNYFESNGLKIGVIGLTTQYIPNWERPEYIQSLTFKSAIKTLKDYLPQLRKQADIVIVSYHGGFEKDIDTSEPTEALTGENEASEILNQFGHDIDILITGHQHRDIAQVIGNTTVIQPGTRATKIGKIILEVDSQKKVIDRKTQLVPVEHIDTFQLEESQTQLWKSVETWLDTPIATLNQPMKITNQWEARTEPHPFINLLIHALLERSGSQIASTALFDSASGFSKNITMRDIINNYPFPNTFKVLEISGKALLDALEKSASYFDFKDNELGINDEFLYPKPQHFNYDIFGGITYTIHASQPTGQRIKDVFIDGEPISNDSSYSICVNNYRAVGGGDYTMFKEAKVIRDIQVEGAQLLIDYLMKQDVNHIPQVIDFKVEA